MQCKHYFPKRVWPPFCERNWRDRKPCISHGGPSCRWFSQFYKMHTPHGNVKIDTWRAPQYIGHVSSRSMMGYNEDRYALGFLTLPIRGVEQPVFNASIFDGHGGDKFAEFLKQNLGNYVEHADLDKLYEQLPQMYRGKFGGYWRTAKIPNSANTKMLARSQYDDMAMRIPLAYLSADFEGMKYDEMTGSTCTSTYLYTVDPQATYWTPGAEVNVVVAQIGDTRAIISDNVGNVLRLTMIHHASSNHEADRLAHYSMGFNTTSDGFQRFLQYVNTRAFGDHQGGGRGMLPGSEAFLVLLTDGVTDKASDQEICDIVIQQAVKGGSLRGTPQDAASEIISYVQMLGTFDNATAVVIRLGGWGNWSHWRDRSGNLREQRLKNTLRRQ